MGRWSYIVLLTANKSIQFYIPTGSPNLSQIYCRTYQNHEGNRIRRYCKMGVAVADTVGWLGLTGKSSNPGKDKDECSIFFCILELFLING